MWAAGEGHRDAISVLLENGAEIKARSQSGFTPLLFAVRNGHLEAAKLLLKLGSDPNDKVQNAAPTQDRYGRPTGGDAPTSALGMAVINAYHDMAAMLIEAGADPNVPDPRGSILHAIAFMRRPGSGSPPLSTGTTDTLELARLLLARGANPNIRIAWKEIVFDRDLAVTRPPPNIPVGRNFLSFVGATPFYVAAKHSDTALMRLLVEFKADPKLPTVQGITPLMAAAGLGFWDGESPGPLTGVAESEAVAAVKLTLDLGNDINAAAVFGGPKLEGDGATLIRRHPLNLTAYDGAHDSPLDVVPPTLSLGDMRWDGSTALHGAAMRGSNAIIEFLVAHGAKLDARNKLGWTPLMCAEGVFVANTLKDWPETVSLIRKLMKDRGLNPDQVQPGVDWRDQCAGPHPAVARRTSPPGAAGVSRPSQDRYVASGLAGPVSGDEMDLRKTLTLFGAGLLVASGGAALALAGRTVSAADNSGTISGVVRSSKGPEAGVWVIAETDDTPTHFRKIVVTDDRGRYLLPELPKAATYHVWVRGYGLVDSKAVPGKIDETLNLTAVLAKTPQEAAEIYPASYWASLLEPPRKTEFPGTGPKGNGINPDLKTQDEFINIIKSCERCHQIGSKITRTIPDLDKFPSAVAAWGSPADDGPARRRDVGIRDADGARPRAEDVRGVDRQDCRRRGAAAAGAAARPGAQRRHHDVDLQRRVPDGPRRGLDRSPQPAAERQWADLRGRLDQRLVHLGQSVGQLGGTREGATRHRDHQAAADRVRSVSLLRRSPGVGEPGVAAQPDDGRDRPCLDHHDAPDLQQPGLVQAGIGQQVRAVSPDRALGRAGRLLRPQDQAVHADRYLLRHASPAVRRGCRQHAGVQQSGRAGGRLDQHEAVRSDARCQGVTRLVSDRDRHQRRRQDHQAVESAGARARGDR